jgi:hypothetical protein
LARHPYRTKIARGRWFGSGQERTVIAMSRSVAISSLRSEFNAFLFATIGNNSKGMQVSVLSGLAQSDLESRFRDP